MKMDISRATPVPYVVYSSGWDQKKTINRLKLFIRITPAARDKDGRSSWPRFPLHHENNCATAIAAAKYYAKDTGATSISVVLDSLPMSMAQPASLRLRITYPDGKGISGKEN